MKKKKTCPRPTDVQPRAPQYPHPPRVSPKTCHLRLRPVSRADGVGLPGGGGAAAAEERGRGAEEVVLGASPSSPTSLPGGASPGCRLRPGRDAGGSELRRGQTLQRRPSRAGAHGASSSRRLRPLLLLLLLLLRRLRPLLRLRHHLRGCCRCRHRRRRHNQCTAQAPAYVTATRPVRPAVRRRAPLPSQSSSSFHPTSAPLLPLRPTRTFPGLAGALAARARAPAAPCPSRRLPGSFQGKEGGGATRRRRRAPDQRPRAGERACTRTTALIHPRARAPSLSPPPPSPCPPLPPSLVHPQIYNTHILLHPPMDAQHAQPKAFIHFPPGERLERERAVGEP
ncbi:uncharacterized protein LOC118851173 [Trichosurus vulpecula]|uniref:uncharacterized protein LOC118851173 n=1 Tax=Trichosurus vulpecula TaxID=9337 RepID=UPI00186B3240|nr:uncharacterized protein LOC118851173 [Trichosurus vulpecula]